MNGITLLLVVFGIMALMIFGIVTAIASFYKKPLMGQAIIRSGIGDIQVAFNKGIMVVPVVHKMEIMNTSMTVIDVNFMHENALVCKDNTRANVKINFLIQPILENINILRAANTIGCKRSFDEKVLKEIYGSKFAETVKTISKDLTFDEIRDYDNFKLHIIQNTDPDLNGYRIDDCIIDHLEKSTYKNADATV